MTSRLWEVIWATEVPINRNVSGVKVSSFDPEGAWGNKSLGLVEKSAKRPVNESGKKGSEPRLDTWTEEPSRQESHLLFSVAESVSSRRNTLLSEGRVSERRIFKGTEIIRIPDVKINML